MASYTSGGAPAPPLAPELLQMIFRHLLPTATPITNSLSYVGSPEFAKKPQLNRELLDRRATLFHICHLSRVFRQVATTLLYEIAILKDQRELLCFFRTLVSAPSLRPAVQKVVWAGILESRTLVAGAETGVQEMCLLVKTYWTGASWPEAGDGLGAMIAHRLGLHFSTPEMIHHGKVLAGILAMTPRLTSLYAFLGRFVESDNRGRAWPYCPEREGICALLDPDFDSPAPPSGRFLQNLESITLVPHSDVYLQTRTGPLYIYLHHNSLSSVLSSVLRNCSHLSRIELKTDAHWTSERLLDRSAWPPMPKVTGDNVTDLIIQNAMWPSGAMQGISTIFPNLRSLYAQFNDPAGDQQFPFGTAQANISNFPRALGLLSETLEVLHLTSSPGTRWDSPSVPHYLSRSFPKMSSLRHLTVEACWLFDPLDRTTFEAASRLPSSLVSFHFIDYWGLSGVDARPRFDASMNRVVFMRKMLNNLRLSCETHLTNLAAVRITSSVHVAASKGWIGYSQRRFNEVGVEFDVAGLGELAAHGQWPWSSIRNGR